MREASPVRAEHTSAAEGLRGHAHGHGEAPNGHREDVEARPRLPREGGKGTPGSQALAEGVRLLDLPQAQANLEPWDTSRHQQVPASGFGQAEGGGTQLALCSAIPQPHLPALSDSVLHSQAPPQLQK